MRYFPVESLAALLSLPTEEPLRVLPPKKPNFEGGGRELAEFSLTVDAESRSLPELLHLNLEGVGEGFLKDEFDPLLSISRPYSPNFLGEGINDLAGEFRLLLVFELKESPPSDFFRCISFSGNLLYSPNLRGSPLLCKDLGGLGKELGEGQCEFLLSFESPLSCILCC